jgi:hypothetical protein
MATARHFEVAKISGPCHIRLFGTVANICASQYRNGAMKYLPVLLLLAGFALAEEPSPDLQLALRGAAALKTNLRDPESLKILRVVITKREVHGDSISDVCLEYNAKNGVGGYTGTDVASYTADPKKETLRLILLNISPEQP